MVMHSRRRFMVMNTTGFGLVLVRCGTVFVDGPEGFNELVCPVMPIAELSDLEEGEPFDFEYPTEGVECFLVKLGEPADGGVGPDGDIVAYSYLCTHMGCSLRDRYDHDNKILGPCGCHFTTFSVRRRGAVVLGQATQNLVQIELSVDDDDMIAATGLVGVLYGELENRCRDDVDDEERGGLP